ncbi:MAG: hypothetical protein ACRD5Z_14210 [Bryobacteraceae bacterium]
MGKVETAYALTNGNGNECSVSEFSVAAYALLLVSAQRAFARSELDMLPPPKWLARSQASRTSTQRLLHQLRAEVWARGLGIDNFSGFANKPAADTRPQKCNFSLASAVCYANA